MNFTTDVIKLLKSNATENACILFDIDILVDDKGLIFEPVFVVYKFSKTLKLNHFFYTYKSISDEAMKETKDKLNALGIQRMLYFKKTDMKEDSYMYCISKDITSSGNTIIMTITNKDIIPNEYVGICVNTKQYYLI